MSKNYSYRRDNRSVKQFAKDIKESTAIESKLMAVYVSDLSSRRNGKYKIEDHGVDNTGKLLSDKKVNTKADFVLITPEGKRHKIEIKFSRPHCDVFHLKAGHLISYIKQDCCIVMFMGIESKNPCYCIIRPKEMQKILDTAKYISLWGKQQVQLPIGNFEWYSVKIPS